MHPSSLHRRQTGHFINQGVGPIYGGERLGTASGIDGDGSISFYRRQEGGDIGLSKEGVVHAEHAYVLRANLLQAGGQRRNGSASWWSFLQPSHLQRSISPGANHDHALGGRHCSDRALEESLAVHLYKRFIGSVQTRAARTGEDDRVEDHDRTLALGSPTLLRVLRHDLFLRACRGEKTGHVPVWFMRQAGRSLPEYRALRERFGMLEMCRTADIAAEVTLQPVRRLGVDAAILFSDIVVPLQPMGVDLEIRPGVGPVIAEPIRQLSDVDRLRSLAPDDGVPYVLDTIRILVEELEVPLIGFAGAPFTLACYLVEGGPSKTHARTKSLMYSQPDTWDRLMNRLADAIGAYLQAQISTGVSAVQLFDSWAGALDAEDYRRYAMPYSQKILDGLAGLGVPRIHFGVGTSELLGLMTEAGADVIGVDWTVPIDDARTRVGGAATVQGNLDPAVCLGPWDIVEGKARGILERGGGRRHVFNLGHGVLPETAPDMLTRLVDFVHGWTPA
jgi:uroporphyrinogen decarboxylase